MISIIYLITIFICGAYLIHLDAMPRSILDEEIEDIMRKYADLGGDISVRNSVDGVREVIDRITSRGGR